MKLFYYFPTKPSIIQLSSKVLEIVFMFSKLLCIEHKLFRYCSFLFPVRYFASKFKEFHIFILHFPIFLKLFYKIYFLVQFQLGQGIFSHLMDEFFRHLEEFILCPQGHSCFSIYTLQPSAITLQIGNISIMIIQRFLRSDLNLSI